MRLFLAQNAHSFYKVCLWVLNLEMSMSYVCVDLLFVLMVEKIFSLCVSFSDLLSLTCLVFFWVLVKRCVILFRVLL